MAKISIILLNWKQPQLTVECIESLNKMTYKDFEVIVVDNASADGSADIIAKSFPELRIIRNEENLGFTGGNNVGIREALKHAPAYVMLLNNDTIVDPNMLTELVKVIESDPKIGMVGPKIYYYGDKMIWSAGTKFSRIFVRPKHIGYRQIDKGQFSQVKDVDELSACAILIRKNVIKKIGLLEEKFFRTAEDTEYSLRMAKGGYRRVFVPASIIWHKVSSSTGGEDSPQNIYYGYRNILYLAKEYFPWAVPMIILKYISKLIYSWLTLKPNLAKAISDGLTDFIKGITGKVEKY